MISFRIVQSFMTTPHEPRGRLNCVVWRFASRLIISSSVLRGELMNMRFRLVTRFCEDMCSRIDYMSPEFYDDVTYMVLVLTEYYWN